MKYSGFSVEYYNMQDLKLFMVLIGCTPKGRNTEQHDIFFSIGRSMKGLLPEIVEFWPEAEGEMHIDAWREVNQVDGRRVSILSRAEVKEGIEEDKLFFINLGGYRRNEFDEFHYKMLVAAPDKSQAIQQAKQTAFYKHTRFDGAESHIDDKFGVDVDDIFQIEDILPAAVKEKYSISLAPAEAAAEDELNLGYFKLSRF